MYVQVSTFWLVSWVHHLLVRSVQRKGIGATLAEAGTYHQRAAALRVAGYAFSPGSCDKLCPQRIYLSGCCEARQEEVILLPKNKMKANSVVM